MNFDRVFSLVSYAIETLPELAQRLVTLRNRAQRFCSAGTSDEVWTVYARCRYCGDDGFFLYVYAAHVELRCYHCRWTWRAGRNTLAARLLRGVVKHTGICLFHQRCEVVP